MAVTTDLRLLDALADAAQRLMVALEADGYAISRSLGDVLLLVTEFAPNDHTLQLGRSYLVSEYPETQRVLEQRESRAICLGEPDLDPAEARLLVSLGFGSLLMLPLELRGAMWGLVELYREEPAPFGPVEMRAAATVLSEFA